MTDRKALYTHASRLAARGNTTGPQDLKDIVDLVFDARCEHEPWDCIRETDLLIRGNTIFNGTDSERLLALANAIEAEHQPRGAQEKRIEQAAQTIFDTTVGKAWDLISETHRGYYRNAARKVLDMLDAQTTDGGEA